MGIDCLPLAGFHEELAFLRLDSRPLADIALCGASSASSFSGGGFSIPRPYDVIGHQIRGRFEIREYKDIEDPTLEKVDFDHAFLLDKKKWESALSQMTLAHADELEACKVSVKVGECDLYFSSTDIEALKRETEQGRELFKYPYKHKDRMPGIYWMFQASYALNCLKTISTDKEVEDFLKKSPKNTYRYKSRRTARKFVWPNPDREKGGGDRGDINLEDLGDSIEITEYKFPFTSKWLSLIFVIADWWADIVVNEPDAKIMTLIKEFDRYKFGGLEIGDLVYLISGSRVTHEVAALFDEYLMSTGRRARSIVEGRPKRTSATGRNPSQR